ncbi:pyridoxal 5'-phosphate synthase subunit PdxT [Microbacterium sorbitolivorans]|uniref:Pyridoxal 5'-phosphate synthase subunit PdxT n=1 Tax=Microbacterium sorbitolivorans TaxID=1867410 RepID=A0A367Y7A8_9MICO|nr:pyridoxal 5'-phosphate synthase glutaminase subunit PdxT [Microbacterium sorbitolivorans]RCK61753.1 pyridoxal 5'-phosphate synthase glutaminase subunit PdxT [Microbacterium sorbitolivorans]GGF29429.1 pyridoxal 5'-phosphate synthase subunit PdxT [Microbacterium sorbitolivorans]
MTRTVGVLALQGNVREHEAMLASLGARVVRVRRPEELAEIDGLVLPGGESSTIDKLSRAFGVRDPLIERIRDGLPVFGTCAGLILLADRIVDGIEGQQTFGGLDATVRRNAFGRQTESFETELDVPELGDPPVRAAFIRAPVIEELGSAARALATLPDGHVVAAEQGAILATSFHPEQTGESRLHERFLARL